MPTNPQVAAGGTGVTVNPTTLATPSQGQVYGSGGANGGVYSIQNGTLYMTGAQEYAKAGGDLSKIQQVSDSELADMNRQSNGYAAKSVGATDPNYLSYFTSGGGTTQMQTVNTAPSLPANAQTIAASTAAQTQQLAGDQGMNVTQTTTPSGVAAVQKTPLGTPAAQTQSQTGQPQQNAGAAGAAIDPQTGQPFTPQQLSSLDLLKQELLGAQHSLTQAGATPNALSDKYNAAFDATKNTQSPDSGSAARQGVTDALNNTNTSNTTATEDFMQGYGSLNAAEKQLYDTIQTQLSATNTQQTLAQQFAAAIANPNNPAGIPGDSLSQEQMKLLDIQKVMSGTEDDIRSEITKAGGFATESQVQALTTARNKTLLTQASYLQQSMALKQDYVDNLMNFTEKDEAQVTADLNTKLGLEQAQVTLAQNMQNAAASNYQNLIKTNGFQGLNAALQGNPTAISAAENALGLPPGAIAREAAQESSALATAADKPLQYVSGTTNQAAGVFDPNTGKFTAQGGGGGSGGGSTGGGTSSPVLSQALQTIKNSLASPTKAQLAQIDAIANNSDPFAAIKNQAQNIMGQTKATQVVSYEQAQSTMQDLSKELGQYYAAEGKTDIFSGTYEDALAKLGTVNDPKLREIATEIEASLQVYRNAISGTAYSVQEGNSIASIFPGINKTEGLNDAIISGRQKAFDSVIDSAYSSVLGSNTYQALKSAYGTQYAPGSIIVSNGKQYQVGSDGQTITPVGGSVDLSQSANVTTNNPIFGSGQSFF